MNYHKCSNYSKRRETFKTSGHINSLGDLKKKMFQNSEFLIGFTKSREGLPRFSSTSKAGTTYNVSVGRKTQSNKQTKSSDEYSPPLLIKLLKKCEISSIIFFVLLVVEK
jgi:hypothetical protein